MRELKEPGVKTLLLIILGGIFVGFTLLLWILLSGWM